MNQYDICSICRKAILFSMYNNCWKHVSYTDERLCIDEPEPIKAEELE